MTEFRSLASLTIALEIEGSLVCSLRVRPLKGLGAIPLGLEVLQKLALEPGEAVEFSPYRLGGQLNHGQLEPILRFCTPRRKGGIFAAPHGSSERTKIKKIKWNR